MPHLCTSRSTSQVRFGFPLWIFLCLIKITEHSAFFVGQTSGTTAMSTPWLSRPTSEKSELRKVRFFISRFNFARNLT